MIAFKKNQTVVNVKIGFAWPFFFALFLPVIAVLAFLRRRLFLQAIIMIAYFFAQVQLQHQSALWVLLDRMPSPDRIPNHDTYVQAMILWCISHLLIGYWARRGNKLTAGILFRRGYVCPIATQAALAEAHWSLSSINPRVMQASIESQHKRGPIQELTAREVTLIPAERPQLLGDSAVTFDGSSTAQADKLRNEICMAVVGFLILVAIGYALWSRQHPLNTGLRSVAEAAPNNFATTSQSLPTPAQQYSATSETLPFAGKTVRLAIGWNASTGDQLYLLGIGGQPVANEAVPPEGFDSIVADRRGVNSAGTEWIVLKLEGGPEACPSTYVLLIANLKVGQFLMSAVPPVCSFDFDTVTESPEGVSVSIPQLNGPYVLSLSDLTLNENGAVRVLR
jgi:hypothetical protein